MAERDYAAMSLDELLKDIEEEKRQRSQMQDELIKVRQDVAYRLVYRGRDYPADAYEIAQDRLQGRIKDRTATARAREIGVSFNDLVRLQGGMQYYPGEVTWQTEIGQQNRETYLKDEIDKITAELKQKDEEKKEKEKKKREQRLWEFTRYYRYISKDNKSNNREFEVRVALPFLADWTENQVKQSQDTIIALCDKALADAWKQTDYADNTYEILDSSAPLEKDWGTPGARGWANGYERKDKTEPLSTSRRVSVEAEVQDKIGKYWKGKLSVIRYWDIPGWSET